MDYEQHINLRMKSQIDKNLNVKVKVIKCRIQNVEIWILHVFNNIWIGI